MAACNTYVRSDSVVSRVIATETLIVPIRGNVGDLASIYSLNETATILWEALSQPKPADELLNLVVDEYDVERDQAANELNAFLAEMCAAGLVQCIDTRAESAFS